MVLKALIVFQFFSYSLYAGNNQTITYIDGSKSGTSFLGLQNSGICSAGACFGVNELQFGILANVTFDKLQPKDSHNLLVEKLISSAKGETVTIYGFDSAENLMSFLAQKPDIAITAAKRIQGSETHIELTTKASATNTIIQQTEEIRSSIKAGTLVPATINNVGLGIPHRVSIVGFAEGSNGIEEFLVVDPNYPETTMRLKVNRNGSFSYLGNKITIEPSIPSRIQRERLAEKFEVKTVSKNVFTEVPGIKKRFISSKECVPGFFLNKAFRGTF